MTTISHSLLRASFVGTGSLFVVPHSFVPVGNFIRRYSFGVVPTLLLMWYTIVVDPICSVIDDSHSFGDCWYLPHLMSYIPVRYMPFEFPFICLVVEGPVVPLSFMMPSFVGVDILLSFVDHFIHSVVHEYIPIQAFSGTSQWYRHPPIKFDSVMIIDLSTRQRSQEILTIIIGNLFSK